MTPVTQEPPTTLYGEVGEPVAPPAGPVERDSASGSPMDSQNIREWSVSLLLHVVVLGLLSTVYLNDPPQSDEIDLTSALSELEPQEQFIEVMNEFTRDETPLEKQISKMPSMNMSDESREAHSRSAPALDMLTENPVIDRQSAFSDWAMEDDLEIEGSTVATANDIGSVDRITQEILGQLKKNKVLVVWLMDASGSLKERRTQIIQRFDRVYMELGELSEDEEDALLTAVASFGEKSELLTPEPTANPDQIKRAVRNMKIDESGVENVFAAIQKTVLELRPYIRKDRRMMMVVLTDETGNDFNAVDATIRDLKKYRVPVYVMGPLSPFARPVIRIKWVDKESGTTHYLPVERGPETIQLEAAKLPTWYEDPRAGLISSGFGPFALTRVAHESGGIYFIYDDGSIPGPRFDVTAMLERAPEYISVSDYMRLVQQRALRRAVLKVAAASQEGCPSFPAEFLAAGVQFAIRDSAQDVNTAMDFLDAAADELIGVHKFRGQETSKRWLAHYDLLIGRVLANRIRCESYLPMLGEMFNKPKTPKDVTKNAWRLAGVEGTALGDRKSPEGEAKQDEGSRKKSRKKPQPVEKTDADIAREHLQRVIAEHDGTPWAVLAQTELNLPLEFTWEEVLLPPPKGEGLPWEKVPWKKLDEKQQKFVREYEEKKKKTEKIEKQRKEQKKKTKIPKL